MSFLFDIFALKEQFLPISAVGGRQCNHVSE